MDNYGTFQTTVIISLWDFSQSGGLINQVTLPNIEQFRMGLLTITLLSLLNKAYYETYLNTFLSQCDINQQLKPKIHFKA